MMVERILKYKNQESVIHPIHSSRAPVGTKAIGSAQDPLGTYIRIKQSKYIKYR